MGKLTSYLCKILKIHLIRTSPYHPETDGLMLTFTGLSSKFENSWSGPYEVLRKVTLLVTWAIAMPDRFKKQ